MEDYKDLGAIPRDDYTDLGAKPRTVPKEEPNALDSILNAIGHSARGVGQGATLGLEDELVGAVNAPMGALEAVKKYAGMDVEQSPELQAYEKSRDAEREANKQAQEESPWLYGGGELLGGLALPLPVVAGAGVKGAIGTGAALGGISGIGGGEGTGEEAAKEALSGTIMGGAAGGLLSGAGKAISALTPTKAKEAFALGKKGISVGTEAADKTLEAEEKSIVNNFISDFAKAKENVGEEIGAAKDLFKQSDNKVDRDKILKALEKKQKELQASDLVEHNNEASKLKTFIDKVKTEEKEVPFTKIEKQEATPKIESTREKLQYEIAKLEDMAKAANENITFTLRETSIQGKPHLAIDKVEQKINAQGQIEPVYKPGKPILAQGEIAAQPEQYKGLGEFMNKIKVEKPSQMMPEEALKLRDELKALGGFTDAGLKFAGKEAKQSYGALAEQLPEDLQALNKKYTDYSDIFDELKLDASQLTKNPITGEVVPDRALQRQLESKFRDLGSSSKSGVMARGDVESFTGKLDTLNPELAAKYKEPLKDIGTRAELGKNRFELDPTAPIASLKSMSVPVANIAGKVAAATGNPTGTLTKPLVTAAKATLSFDNPALQSASTLARKMGQNKFADNVDKIISEQAGSVKRNALIFSLLQNPEYRNMLKDMMGE